MKKKMFTIIYVVLTLITLKLFATYFINEISILNYNKKVYKPQSTLGLLLLNFPEPCIAHYNLGNIYYRNNDFGSAIFEYEKALNSFPSHTQECDIRINLALAKLKQINEDDKSELNITATLDILYEAREILYTHGCANENDETGHKKEAEQLEEDINKKIRELQNSAQQPQNEPNSDDQEQPEEEMDVLEAILKELQNQGYSERQNHLENMKNLDIPYTYYPGKKW